VRGSGFDFSRTSSTFAAMQRLLILLGVALLALGLLWPFVGKLGLGRLPGDIVIERGHFRFYFPLATSFVISLVLSLVLWLTRR
jgi:Protein of unknown function (DUF2905)